MAFWSITSEDSTTFPQLHLEYTQSLFMKDSDREIERLSMESFAISEKIKSLSARSEKLTENAGDYFEQSVSSLKKCRVFQYLLLRNKGRKAMRESKAILEECESLMTESSNKLDAAKDLIDST
jgi:hypothetical protein